MKCNEHEYFWPIANTVQSWKYHSTTEIQTCLILKLTFHVWILPWACLPLPKTTEQHNIDYILEYTCNQHVPLIYFQSRKLTWNMFTTDTHFRYRNIADGNLPANSVADHRSKQNDREAHRPKPSPTGQHLQLRSGLVDRCSALRRWRALPNRSASLRSDRLTKKYFYLSRVSFSNLPMQK